jgi:hypothetical protein
LENCAGGVHDQLWQTRLWKGIQNRRIDAVKYIGDNIFWVLRTQRRTFLQSGPVAQLGARFHGMEEVVGSIPTRSTKSLNNLDGASASRYSFCVMVCVITCRFSAYGKGFHRIPLRFHPHMAIAFQHPAANVSRNDHDRRV